MNLTFKKFIGGLAIVLLAVLISQEISRAKNSDASALEVNFLNVGQGDATLINYLGQYQALIDGGSNGKKLLSELGKAMPWGDKNIELVILTHPDADHLSGLVDLLDNYEAGIFLDNGQEADTEIYKQLKQKIEDNKIKKESLAEGSNFNIGELLNFKIFNPDEAGISGEERNDNSVVLKMEFGENSFLFTGDAETSAEGDMIYDEENINVDWLKVGHHGSKNSTAENFIEAVSPRYAIISAGAGNRYGHPHEETLARLKNKNVDILRTDEKGTIKIACSSLDKKCEVK